MLFKKTILFFLFFQFIINKNFCQDWCDTVIANIKGKKLLSQIQPELKMISENADYYVSDREYEFGVKVFFDVCTSKAFKNSGKKDSAYLIKIYSKNDTIFLIDVSVIKVPESVNNPKLTKKFTALDTSITKMVLNLHNEKYSSSWQIADYFYELYYNVLYTSTKSLKIYLAELIKNRKHEKLISWASSLDPETRAWGTIGLYLLKLEGVKTSALEEELIAINRASHIVIPIIIIN